MANKYTALPVPDKSELEKLYHEDYLSQSEIGKKYNTTQKVVFAWFKKLGIKSRIPFKRNQFGNKNASWKGDNATYAAFHYRVVSERGRPKKCEVCGTEDNEKIYDWACVGRYENVNDYKRMCRSCHWKHDKIGNNFPNHKEEPSKITKNVKKHA